MGLKGLFVGVYASNSVLRTLFLPLLYFVLASPFVTVLVFYLKPDLGALNFWKNTSTTDILLQVFVSAIALLLPTRILTGKGLAGSKDAGKRKVQQLPYWIPGLRHWGNLVFGGEGWLKGVRQSAVLPLVAYNAAGKKHNIIFSPELLEQVLNESGSLEGADINNWTPLQNAFNISNETKNSYLQLLPEFRQTVDEQIFKGQEMEKVLSTSLRLLTGSLPDLITFNTSIVDQMSWERVAGIELTDGTEEAECDLFALINEFFCNAFIAPLTGPQFPESYLLLASDLWSFNQLYYALAAGLPRLLPMGGLPSAMLAKRRLLQNFDRLFRELTDPPKKRVPDDDESLSGDETDAEAPTPFSVLNDLFTKHGIPNRDRTAIALELLHNIFSEVVPVACWTILHIYQASVQAKDGPETLIDSIRQETKLWVEGTQPPSIHPSFPTPPEISFMGTARPVASTSFPQLCSCINEARRLYKASASTLTITKPITITEPINIRPGVKEQWELEVGSCVDVGISQTLINTSAANFLSPNDYQPDRFVDSPPPSSVTSPSDPHEPFATALLISLVAGILQLWEIAPAPKKTIFDLWQEASDVASGEKTKAPHVKNEEKTGERKEGKWVVPKAVDGGSFKVPEGEVRVRIKRREGLPEARTMRKGK
ncbi:hypothetical protein P280DRAFT_406635 [Massarina eburnea CBS 473.64]|uniref:Cytochrome P450 n=1 Tax=Massarina eburnea CBS 473.64 TaxID=1395130 RepID=A0A6A6RTZ8_9PLEO|nr:hypothetical protein P280DRAFT_406635 [Massarina eburnea CBS 473.64]